MAFFQPGQYKCRIVNQGFGRSTKKNTPYFFLAFRPLKLIHDGQETNVDRGYDRDLNLYLTAGAVDRTVEILRSLGWTGDSFGDIDPIARTHHSFIDQEVVLECRHELMDNGSTWEKWEFPWTGRMREHVAERELTRKLDATFGEALKFGQPSKSLQEQAAELPADDEVPF